MSLSDWQKNGWIKAHQSSPAEIADLLALAERDLKDARAKGLSEDWRFAIAYNAALQAASAALAASGFAVSKGDSNHFRVLQSLSLTIGTDKKTVDRWDAYRKKRSISIYDVVGAITSAEAREILAAARELVDDIRAWLASTHPELMPAP